MALLASPTNPRAHPSSPLLRTPNKLKPPTIRLFSEIPISFKRLNSKHFVSRIDQPFLPTSRCRRTGDYRKRASAGDVEATTLGAPPPAETLEVPPSANDRDEANFARILLSDVVVKRPRNVFWGRKWNSLDVGTAAIVVLLHLLCLFAPVTFSWPALWVSVGLYAITGLLGITLSFHRNLSHRSFKLPKWLEYFFAYCGVQALQGNPIDWVSTHRYHHQFCDSEKDPHSPIEGFWLSHMNWLFDTSTVIERCGGTSNVGDLQKQPFYRFVQSTYIVHPIAFGALLCALGGFPFVVWGMGVRIVWVYHITWLVNSATHIWGKQAWNTGDLSKNNWWVALLAFGEGWHNNHHAFEYSARHGLEWWQVDMTWYMVRVLQAVGLATDVKLPTEAHKRRMSFSNN
ncbi:palmitoyl-monogalactosyldiacylglycerol delta-7 desaturase, chloroplastic-like [Malania oleifera]|uniref:palmitoyl-monogalactosyldiacylglycerol delta-7 desaturase, chloroplastic-like n=1 Tax=Malania oleifera TaxID=397392 RepID=UPI0025ADD835|nr:palmitoyl-monogalactosyldiacylglycerol delta-7 desaturase, chloroplastic-like [Malania oleifera]